MRRTSIEARPCILSSKYFPNAFTFANINRVPTSYSLRPKRRPQKVNWNSKASPNSFLLSADFKFGGMTAKKDELGPRSPKRTPRRKVANMFGAAFLQGRSRWAVDWSSMSWHRPSLSQLHVAQKTTIPFPKSGLSLLHSRGKPGRKAKPRISRWRNKAHKPPDISKQYEDHLM